MFKIKFAFSREDFIEEVAQGMVGKPLCKDGEVIGEILRVWPEVSAFAGEISTWTFEASIIGEEEAYKSLWVPGAEGMAIGLSSSGDLIKDLKADRSVLEAGLQRLREYFQVLQEDKFEDRTEEIRITGLEIATYEKKRNDLAAYIELMEKKE